MKRTPLRRKSLKPRKWQDDTLNRAYADEIAAPYFAYVDDPQNDHCEIAWYLGACFSPFGGRWEGLQRRRITPESGAHHIFSVSGQRLHERSNLIRIAPHAHRLVHNGTHGEPQSIRLLCIAAKIEKRTALNDSDEFDLEVMHAVSGKTVRGWLEMHEFPEPWLEAIRDKALSRLAALKTIEGAE